jgi:hypothetical protein
MRVSGFAASAVRRLGRNTGMADELFKKQDFSKEKQEIREQLDSISTSAAPILKEVPKWTPKFIPEIEMELERLYSGQSKYLNYGVQKSGLTVPVAKSRMQRDFTHTNILAFLQMAEQDFSLRVRNYFEYLLMGGNADEYED